METLCPSVQSSARAVRDQLSLGGILRAFLPVLLHLLNLGAHKRRCSGSLLLWYTGLGAIFSIVTLSAPTLGAALLRQPSLSALPDRQKLAMARKADTEFLTDHLLPLRLHSAGGTQFPDASQPA